MRDPSGAIVETDPGEIRILHGFSVSKPPLSQSIGVLLSDGSVSWYVKKGAALPTRQRKTHTTTIPLDRNKGGVAIHVPIVQGESANAKRNKVIGVLHIEAAKISRDLPLGSEVQVTLSVDESSRAQAQAYVPLLDQVFDDVMQFELEAKEATTLKREVAESRSRLAELESLANDLDPEDGGLDARIAEAEALIQEGDRDAADVADQLLRGVAADLDAANAKGRVAIIETRFASELGRARSLVQSHGEPADHAQLAAIIKEYGEAKIKGDVDLAEARCGDLENLVSRVLFRVPEFWFATFQSLAGRFKAPAPDIASLIAAGNAALSARDHRRLMPICVELVNKVPTDDHESPDITRVLSNIR